MLVRMMARDPVNGLIQGSRLRFPELFQRNSLIDDAGRRIRGEFLRNEKHRLNVSRRPLRFQNVSHVKRVGNLVHEVNPVLERQAWRSSRKLEDTGCSRVFANVYSK